MPAASHTPDGPALPVYVEIPCGTEDIGPKTKGMTTTLLTLWLTGQALLCSFDSKFEEYLHGVHNSMAEASVFLFVLRPGFGTHEKAGRILQGPGLRLPPD